MTIRVLAQQSPICKRLNPKYSTHIYFILDINMYLYFIYYIIISFLFIVLKLIKLKFIEVSQYLTFQIRYQRNDVVHDTLTITSNNDFFFNIFQNTKQLLQNFEEMFPRYYTHCAVCNGFKFYTLRTDKRSVHSSTKIVNDKKTA